MPDILAALLPAAAEAGVGLGGEALLGGGAEAGANALLGGAADAALSGAAEVGSGALLGGAADLGAAGIAGAAPALVGGATEVGTGAAGGGVDLGGLLTAASGDSSVPPNATFTSGTDLPFSLGGVSSIGGADAAGGAAAVPGASSVMAANPAGVNVPGVMEGASAAGAASAAPPAGAGPLDLTSLLSKAGSSIGNNPLGLALAAGGLGYNIFKGQQPAASTDRITGQDVAVKQKAGEIMGSGQQLASHVESGTLPPALQQQLDNQLKDAKTKIISTYAANGMNTDPKKNSMLQQELNALDKQGLSLKGEMEKQLLASGATLINSGTALVGADNDLIKTLSGIDQNQQKQISTAIANFAAALSGKSGTGLTLNLGGKTP